jgi:hypothetical protein
MGVEKSVVDVEMLRSVQCSNVKSELCLTKSNFEHNQHHLDIVLN